MGIFTSTLPPIIVGEADRHDLLVLAMGGSGHSADEADHLLYELGRARTVADSDLPYDVVRMGSVVRVSVDGGSPRHGRLAYPQELGADTISIFSPVGTALLGLRAGQTMFWTDRDGQRREIKVHSVFNPD